jgi:hypothetical protein
VQNQSGFAGTVGAQDSYALATRHMQINPAQSFVAVWVLVTKVSYD